MSSSERSQAAPNAGDKSKEPDVISMERSQKDYDEVIKNAKCYAKMMDERKNDQLEAIFQAQNEPEGEDEPSYETRTKQERGK
jgi:hypothetical protein